MDLKKKIDDDSDENNPQLIGSLMYPVNTRLDSCRFRLRIKYNGPEEHILLMFHLEVFLGFVIQQETKLCGLEVHQRQSIYNSEYAKQCGFKYLRRYEIPSYQRYDT
jgi:hypothetical protein